MKTTITLPYNQVGEPSVDLSDLFEQLNDCLPRHEITVRRQPGRNHHHRITVDGRTIR